MNTTVEITEKDLNIILSTIQSFPGSEKLQKEDLEKIARRALETNNTSSEEWLKHQLANFQNIEKEELKKEEVKLIKPSEPLLVNSQKELDEALELHKIWIEGLLQRTTLTEGKRANLSQANLNGLTIEKVNLSCASFNETSFIGAKITEVNFSGASINEANFQGALIKSCVFKKTKMLKADFREAEISDCEFTESQKEQAVGLFLHMPE